MLTESNKADDEEPGIKGTRLGIQGVVPHRISVHLPNLTSADIHWGRRSWIRRPDSRLETKTNEFGDLIPSLHINAPTATNSYRDGWGDACTPCNRPSPIWRASIEQPSMPTFQLLDGSLHAGFTFLLNCHVLITIALVKVANVLTKRWVDGRVRGLNKTINTLSSVRGNLMTERDDRIMLRRCTATAPGCLRPSIGNNR